MIAAPTSVVVPGTYGPPNPSATDHTNSPYRIPTEEVHVRANRVSSASAKHVWVLAVRMPKIGARPETTNCHSPNHQLRKPGCPLATPDRICWKLDWNRSEE